MNGYIEDFVVMCVLEKSGKEMSIMAEIIVINPTKTMESMGRKLRVGAYVRVSSDSDDQENSYIVQYDYYTNLISSNPDWIFVDIYADEGITGTAMDKRDDFNRMVEDAKAGKLDLILVKSVSRFARNTLDCVEMERILKLYGVGVYFEKENINTKNMVSEVELAAIGSIAQEESMSISKNVRAGIQYRMKNGTYKQGCLPYGFRIENDEWVIVEEQARVIRLIFNSYINGTSLEKIARQLTLAKVIKNDGTYKWNTQYIAYIIRNVRYKGDALLQKSYTEEFPFKTRINYGEKDMYYIKNANPAIVSEGIFDKANRLLDEQSKRYRTNTAPKGYLLSKMIFCGECGTMYRRKSGEVRVYWVCRNKDTNGTACSSQQISEDVIIKGFINMYNRLVNNVEIILTPIVTQLTELRSQKLRSTGLIENINKEIAEISEQILMYREMNSQGYIESALYYEKTNEANTKIMMLKKDKKLLMGNDECDKVIKKTELLINLIKSAGAIGEMDEGLFKKIVKKIWIGENRNITYELINGLKLSVEYQEV